MASNGEAKRLEEKASDAVTVGATPPDDSSPSIVSQQPKVDLFDAVPTATTTSTSSKPPLEQENEGGNDPVVKELRIENSMLRKENEELRELLQKQLESLKMSRATLSESTNNDVDLLASGGKILNMVYSQGQKPKRFDKGECTKDVGVENRKGELEQGTKSSGESCCALGAAEKGSCSGPSVEFGHTLSADAIRRYSRQLLVPSFGVAGQERLLMSSALVVGCGGLGSPIALYLAAAGVGCLGLVDHDIVELSNLHRQVIHTEAFVGKPKVKSAASACRGLNSSVQILEYVHRLDAANAVEIVSNYADIVAFANGRYRVDYNDQNCSGFRFDVVLDATDNLPTRYLLNDACVATGKPLVSGAALGVEGQVTVYNHKNGPCYRCLFPIPPPQGARQRCSDNGVIGVVPGIIGTFQALEALKIAGGVGEVLSGRMLLLDALSTRIHMVKLRCRSVACVACGDIPQISRLNLHDYDYETFTQSPLSDEAPEGQHIIPETERLSIEELKKRLESGQAHVLLDVRDAHEYAISRLPNSLNIPFSSMKQKLQVLETAVEDSRHGHSSASSFPSPAIYVVCRRGNDSQRAVQFLRNEGFTTAVDVIGGLESWVKTVNNQFPFY